MFKKMIQATCVAAALAVMSVSTTAQVTLPASGVSGEDVANAAVAEVVTYAGPAILGGLALFALGLGIYWVRRQIKKGSSAGG